MVESLGLALSGRYRAQYLGIFVFSGKQNRIDFAFRSVQPCTEVEAVFETAS